MPHHHHQQQHRHHQQQQQQQQHNDATNRCKYCTISELSFPARFQYFALDQRCQPFAQCRGGPRVSIDTRASTPSHHNRDRRSHIIVVIVVIVSSSSILLVFIFVIVIIFFIILPIGTTPTSPGIPLPRFSAVAPLHCPHSTRTRPRARSRASTRTRARSRASTGTRARLIFVQTQRFNSC